MIELDFYSFYKSYLIPPQSIVVFMNICFQFYITIDYEKTKRIFTILLSYWHIFNLN